MRGPSLVQRLSNARWGFESSCFVCEESNERGLRLPFFHDEEHGVVVADFELDESLSGAPSYAHGGVVLAILDEAMAWAAIALASQWALTKETTTRFERPVRIGRPHRVTARLDSVGGEEIQASAEVVDGKDRLCARASAVFTPLGLAQAVDAVGGELSPDDRPFVRDS